MRKIGVMAGAAAMAAAALVVSVPSWAQMEPPAVKERQEAMKEMGKQSGVIKGFVTEDKGDAAAVKAAADKIAATAKTLPALFPKGSGRGDVDPKATRAMPKIWEDWAGFQAAAKALETEAMALSKAADSGDKTAIASAFDSLGKKGCGGCHTAYRGPKVE